MSMLADESTVKITDLEKRGSSFIATKYISNDDYVPSNNKDNDLVLLVTLDYANCNGTEHVEVMRDRTGYN